MKRITKLFSTLTVLSVSLTSCAALFESKVPMATTGNISNLTSLVVPDEKIEQLSAPAQIFVSQAESSSTIIVTWSAVQGATSYYLERAVATEKDANGRFICPDESEFKPMALKHTYGTTYEDKILDNPKYSDEEYSYGYFYRVSAENPRLKHESSEFIVSEAAYLLSPPSNVKASLGEAEDRITVRWDKVPGARNYDIYRSTREDGSSPVFMGTVSSNQNWFDNTVSKQDQGTDFYYSVYTKTVSNSSVPSALALGYALQAGAPTKVTGVEITSGRGDTQGEISIKWNSAGDAHFAVYRTSSKDASYTLLSKDQTTTTFKDTKGLKANVYYYYQVQAFKDMDGVKVKGPFSDSGAESSSPAEGFLLVPPTNIEVVKNKLDASLCSITFTPAIGSKDYPGDSGLTNDYKDYTYVVYKGDTADGAFSELARFDTSSLTKTEEGNYIATIASANYYKVSTVNGSSESVQSEVTAPAPFAASNPACSKAENIPGAANANGVLPVKITWSAPKNDVAEGGYYVYRSTNPQSGFKKITDEPLMTTSYIDTNDTAKAGVYYYYKVLSLNSLSQGSNYTDAVIGYGALTPDQYMREYNKTVMASQKKLKLMHIADDMKKLGSETAYGALSGSLSYNAAIAGLGAKIVMHYQDYADFWANGDPANGYYFLLTGNSDTSASMDASGGMSGTVICTGMYPGSVCYDRVQIKGGGAAGGTYGIKRAGFDGQIEVDWKVGEEGR